MSEPLVFDESDDGVLEVVLSSEAEFAGDGFIGEDDKAERVAQRRGIAARFLPGVDAGALFALAFALVALTSSSLIDIVATNHQVAMEFSAGTSPANNPYALITDATHIRAFGGGSFASAACVIAVLVLSRWQEGKHARWSRPVGQAALGLGLIALVFAALLYTGAVAGTPAWNTTHPGVFGGSSG